ncbi:twin-arginine translocase subunit TatC [Spartinivicinus ruber]|uniref:twin-arginine translocase subunit TatC n=1 Tax=Spartinivicinus ruber TaxID=2683272 RepID=UPI0013D1B260|nr:twin-arginine translocase subunit TatC [Spartinivicinus ruber]
MTDQSDGYYNSDDPELGQEQPLVQHLVELRSRILRCLVAVLIAFACLFYFANDIYSFISEPLRSILPEGSSMIATEITQTFFTPFKLTVVAAIFLAIPYILHQVWGFIAPGLYQHERKLAIPLLASSVMLFYLGIAFAYYVVFPLLFNFFTTIGPEDVSVMPDIHSYLSIVLKLFFAFGIAFEIPIATVLLIWSGISSVTSLRKKRPYIIVGCFVVGMLLTPPDVFSQSLLAIPMWLLFETGVLMGGIVAKRKSA